MANQPGYQVPGQSNTAPQDSGSYYQNQIMGAGYGTGQGFLAVHRLLNHSKRKAQTKVLRQC